jgi:hypothetical protein
MVWRNTPRHVPYGVYEMHDIWLELEKLSDKERSDKV